MQEWPVANHYLPITIHNCKKGVKMPKIEVTSFPEVFIVGLKIKTGGMSNEIPKLWEALGPRRAEINDLDESEPAAYGISIMDADFEKTKVFDYIAGFPVNAKADELPEGMVDFKIPGGEYATVVCPNLASTQQAYEALYYRWLPESDYALDLSNGNFCFELYGEEFDPGSGSEKYVIYVPVKKK
jgi:predicted transcriptional regulator YdeE